MDREQPTTYSVINPGAKRPKKTVNDIVHAIFLFFWIFGGVYLLIYRGIVPF